MEGNKTNYSIIKADSRGHADHGWLNTHHSFSFANYYDPQRVNFGALRVLNDDRIAAGEGFGKHPHDNMEIITIPLKGDLKHADSMGNTTVIREGDIQVMSAGKGIFHSEVNNNTDKDVELLQIWVIPEKLSVEPRYGQITLEKESLKNRFKQIISPNTDDEGLWIYQKAWFYIGELEEGHVEKYKINSLDNGIYIFVIEGSITVDLNQLNRRDAISITEAQEVTITSDTQSKVLIIEVPLKLN
jgi:redox-sensitive bicupin YhaK (pirin superfamily)